MAVNNRLVRGRFCLICTLEFAEVCPCQLKAELLEEEWHKY